MNSKLRLGLDMESRQQVEEAAAVWIARRDTGPWAENEAAAFEAWLAESAQHRVAYFRLNAAWEDAGRLKASLRERARPAPQRPPVLRIPLTLAASLLLAVGAAVFVLRDGLFSRHSYATVVGGLEAVPMPDGSRVTLNTDSRLRIAMTESERRVDLDRGEAFFEVARDPRRPFVVGVGNRRVIAVGTAFSVRREGDDVRVIVAEGAVRMEDAGGSHSSSLPPLAAGSIARARRNDVDVLVQTRPIAEIEQNLSWRNGLLTFRDTPLDKVVAEFNRYNARKIVIDDPQIASMGVGGIFRATNVGPFVHLLEEGFPIRATVEKDRIILNAR